MLGNATDTTPPRPLVIVDPELRKYDALIERDRARLTTTACGLSALRLVPSHCDALWIVNSHLPDMSGLRLLEMLRSLLPQLPVVLVDDHYDLQCEQRALEMGAAGYYCRPVPWEWIELCHGLAPVAHHCVDRSTAQWPPPWRTTASSN